MIIVADASVVLEILLRRPEASRWEDQLFSKSRNIVAPHLIDVEVLQVIRRYNLAKEISDSRANVALADFVSFPLFRYPHEPFLLRIWELRRNISSYDAAYIALAEALRARFATMDKRLARVAEKFVSVEV